MKFMLPRFAWPIVFTFFIGWALVLLFPTATLFGISHHAWTGLLFWGTLAAGLCLLVAGIRREKLNDNRPR